MSWFKRLKEGITTPSRQKKETPDGVWFQCDHCKEASTMKEFKEHYYTCPRCEHHTRIGSKEYFELLFDQGAHEILFHELVASDPLHFKDLKEYTHRLTEAYEKTHLRDAINVGFGKIYQMPLVVAAMDFSFIGGSMGSVVGEKISKAIDHAIANKAPLLIISRSGGARMMESAFSLMQLAKTSAKLTLLAEAGLPYISLMTDPTTGGVTASFAMLGDLNIAEPNALIGFAGPRVIKEFMKTDLPEGFQRSEFVQEHGFLDFIVSRKHLRKKLGEVISMFMKKPMVSESGIPV